MVNWNDVSKKWPHLTKINFPDLPQKREVDILIGIDHASLHCAKQEVCGADDEPIARLTPLGWTCIGPTEQQSNIEQLGEAATHSTSFFTNDLHTMVRRLWEVEGTMSTTTDQSEQEKLSTQESQIMNITQASLTRTNGGGYQVSVPWINGRPELPDNFEMAVNRLHSTE